MAKYTVEMFGLPYSISGVRQVELELDDEAGLLDLVGALRRAVPSLEGEVITPGADFLMEGFTFNVNGRFHFNDSDLKLKEGDNIVLLTMATVG